MRVKLSYTVDEEDVLREAAKILNLSADDMQQGVNLFSSVQKELRCEDTNSEVVNLHKCYEMIDEFRRALLSVDTRLQEILDMVYGYDEYLRHQKAEDAPGPLVQEGAPQVSVNEV
jgi:hypothetical protein